MQHAPTIAVLAGGLATRLGALAKQTPKCLLEVSGRPFLAWQLDLFAAQGICEVVLCIGHHGEQVVEWASRHAPSGMRVRFSRDGASQLGTGGALRNALPLLGDSFLVTYGDSYLRGDYLAVYRRFLELGRAASQDERPLGLMTVYENCGRFDTSNVVARAGRIEVYDKALRLPEMRHIDWGLGVLTPEAFAPFAREAAFDLAQVYQRLVQEGRLAAFEVGERFYEIGSEAGLTELRELAAQGLLPGAG